MEENSADYFIYKMYDKCFSAINDKNSKFSTAKEQKLQNCYGRFLESYRVVSEVFLKD